MGEKVVLHFSRVSFLLLFLKYVVILSPGLGWETLLCILFLILFMLILILIVELHLMIMNIVAA